MDGKMLLFKAAAVVSALAIGGGFVAWRSGEARKAEQRELSRKAAWAELDLIDAEKVTEMQDPDLPETMLPSSKSIAMPIFSKRPTRDPLEIFDGYLLQLPKEQKTVQELFPSSKIGILRLPAKEAEPPKKNEPRLLPGSKSSIFIPEKPEPAKSE